MRRKDIKVGFLSYDLQEVTADIIQRINQKKRFYIKAFPVLAKVATDYLGFDYLPGKAKARGIVFDSKEKTPEGLMLSCNLRAAFLCVKESDIIVLFGLQGLTALFGVLFAKCFKKPLVSVNQMLPKAYEEKRRWWIRILKRWVLRNCVSHVAQNPAARSNLVELYGIAPNCIFDALCENNFRVITKYKKDLDREEIRKKNGWRDSTCIILFVATLVRYKGAAWLLESVAALNNSDLKVVFCGPEALQAGELGIQDYVLMAKKLGVEELISFKGNLDLAELAEYYMSSDIFVLPTFRDMWPKVIVEAAAYGLPLITTLSCGCAGVIVVEGESGYIVDPEDPGSLSRALQQLSNKGQRVRMGRRAFEICENMFDPEKEINGFLAAIELAIDRQYS